AVALLLLNWTRRRAVIAKWAESTRAYAGLPWLGANLVLFLGAVIGALALDLLLAQSNAPAWGAFALWCGWTALTIPPLVLAFAPLQYWVNFVRSQRLEISLAVVAALVTALVMAASQRSWDVLSDWTLQTAVSVLRVYERDLHFDIAANVIRVGN